jgi:hypothetical protein
MKAPAVTICVLTYGDYPELTQRAIDSIRGHCSRSEYRLVIGANAPGRETLSYLERLQTCGALDHLIVSTTNVNKCPMMRRMLDAVTTDFIWWFDDDSYITHSSALGTWLECARSAAESTVMWGKRAFCEREEAFTDLPNACHFVRTASWYRGLPPPSWRLGGKGEFNFQNRGCGDGRWFFILGGCWLIRTAAMRKLGWPDPRLIKLGDDVFLGEAIRQNGWEIMNTGTPGVAIDTAPRRGQKGSCFSTLHHTAAL